MTINRSGVFFCASIFQLTFLGSHVEMFFWDFSFAHHLFEHIFGGFGPHPSASRSLCFSFWPQIGGLAVSVERNAFGRQVQNRASSSAIFGIIFGFRGIKLWMFSVSDILLKKLKNQAFLHFPFDAKINDCKYFANWNFLTTSNIYNYNRIFCPRSKLNIYHIKKINMNSVFNQYV